MWRSLSSVLTGPASVNSLWSPGQCPLPDHDITHTRCDLLFISSAALEIKNIIWIKWHFTVKTVCLEVAIYENTKTFPKLVHTVKATFLGYYTVDMVNTHCSHNISTRQLQGKTCTVGFLSTRVNLDEPWVRTSPNQITLYTSVVSQLATFKEPVFVLPKQTGRLLSFPHCLFILFTLCSQAAVSLWSFRRDLAAALSWPLIHLLQADLSSAWGIPVQAHAQQSFNSRQTLATLCRHLSEKEVSRVIGCISSALFSVTGLGSSQKYRERQYRRKKNYTWYNCYLFALSCFLKLSVRSPDSVNSIDQKWRKNMENVYVEQSTFEGSEVLK